MFLKFIQNLIYEIYHTETDRNMKNPNFLVGGRDGRRLLPKSMMKRFLSLVAGFGFTLLLLPMTASET